MYDLLPGLSSSKSMSPSSSYEPMSESPESEFRSQESSGMTKSLKVKREK